MNNSYILLLLTVSSAQQLRAEITPAQKAEVVSKIQQLLDDYATAVTSKDLKGQLSFWSDSLVFAGDGMIYQLKNQAENYFKFEKHEISK